MKPDYDGARDGINGIRPSELEAWRDAMVGPAGLGAAVRRRGKFVDVV